MKISSIIWIAAIIILGGGFLFLLINSKNNNQIKSEGLPVQVEVFSDYNCPHCADFVPFVEDVANTFGDKVNIQKKQSPFLADSSYNYAYAAEAARLQGKFNEYNHDLFAWVSYLKDKSNTIFTYTEDDKAFYSQDVNVTELAKRLGLDVDKFESDRKSSTIISLVQNQKADLTKRAGAVSTPAVYIYGQVFNMSTYEDLKAKVQELINTAESQNTNNEAQ